MHISLEALDTIKSFAAKLHKTALFIEFLMDSINWVGVFGVDSLP